MPSAVEQATGIEPVGPFQESRNDDAFEKARTAVAAIRGRGRGPDGRVTAGNTAAMRHGLHSSQLLQHPDLATWHRDQVEAITTDLGGASELSTLACANVREAARLEVILDALGAELFAHGVLTPKGKMRAASTLYLQVFDRFMRVSTNLGLTRRPRTIPTAAELLGVKR